jgi:hypothetical protein
MAKAPVPVNDHSPDGETDGPLSLVEPAAASLLFSADKSPSPPVSPVSEDMSVTPVSEDEAAPLERLHVQRHRPSPLPAEQESEEVVLPQSAVPGVRTSLPSPLRASVTEPATPTRALSATSSLASLQDLPMLPGQSPRVSTSTPSRPRSSIRGARHMSDPAQAESPRSVLWRTPLEAVQTIPPDDGAAGDEDVFLPAAPATSRTDAGDDDF